MQSPHVRSTLRLPRSIFQTFKQLLLKDYEASFQLKKFNAALYTIISTVISILTLKY